MVLRRRADRHRHRGPQGPLLSDQTIETSKETLEWLQSTDAARDRVLAARAALGQELERLRGVGARRGRHPREDPPAARQGRRGRRLASRSWLLAGPQRCRPPYGKRASSGAPRAAARRVLPDEIEKTLRKLGDDGEKVRGTLERDFAGTRRRRRRGRASVRSARSLAELPLRPLLTTCANPRAPATWFDSGPNDEGFEARLARRSARRREARAAAQDAGEGDERRRVDRRGRRRVPGALNPAPRRTTPALDWPAGEWRNGRRAGLRSRCRVSGVEVRPLSRLPTTGRSPQRRRPIRPPPGPSRPYTSRAMQITRTPAPKSTVQLQIELPPSASTAPSTRRPRPRRAAPGPRLPARQGAARRPGAPPRSRRRPRRGRRSPHAGRLSRRARPGGHPPADERRRRGRPGRGGQAAHLQGDDPGPARSQARRLQGLQLPARASRSIDDARVDQVVEELRDQNATLAAVEDRGAKDGDYAVISFVGTRDGEPFEGGTSERMPLILGQERLIPGFEANLIGLEVGDTTEFDITFPDDYPETEHGRQGGPLRGRAQGAAREGPARPRRGLPGQPRRLRDRRRAARPTSRHGSRRNALDRARHRSPTGSSSTRSPTRPSSCPTS